LLYSRNFCTSGSSSDSVFADRRYSAASACTSVVPSFVISSSYLFSTLSSLSNIALLAEGPPEGGPYVRSSPIVGAGFSRPLPRLARLRGPRHAIQIRRPP